ncbi:uncharacterized protein LOC132178128 [Corylus avellana]|uniref:uncharacterized protein LOC132178128 n=1 Tax=Corylus avellana TaxID=13451 RepID=UPI00286CD9FF|nr:uncharacterized protein LOC132178128 [Corylus avellana]
MHPSVYSLQLHLENQQAISFCKSDNLTHLVNNDTSAKSMLTEFFSKNKVDENAQRLLYKEYPEHYVWNQRDKIWTLRKKQSVIGTVVAANLIEGERYYLRLLLNHIRGPSSFEDLKQVGGIMASTFREAASLHGLLEADNSLEKCLEEASSYQMPYSLRRLFATILVYCNPSNPRALWEQFEESMSEDFKKSKGLITTLSVTSPAR